MSAREIFSGLRNSGGMKASPIRLLRAEPSSSTMAMAALEMASGTDFAPMYTLTLNA